jgi:23S rRNA (guanosine2251-2'-O)-methyltransferase
MSPSEIICGVNAVLEVLRAEKRRVFEILVASGKRRSTVERIEAEAVRLGVPITEVSRARIQELSRIEKNQGVAARTEPYCYSLAEDIARAACGEKGFVVILDDILDPQNVGSLIRTAHLTGASGMILPKDRAAAIGPAATRASAGATEYLPIARVTNLANTLEMLKEQGLWIVGAEGESPEVLYEYDFSQHPHGIVLGGEGRGIRRLIRERCDKLLTIPMQGRVGSYNVSVAGAFFMGEASRQRWAKKSCKSHTF